MLFPINRSSAAICWRCLARTRGPPALGISILPLRRIPKKLYATAAAVDTSTAAVSLAHTRNIGIIAHIDAVGILVELNCNSWETGTDSGQGKTTTTERMLYYSGFTRRIGGKSFSYN